MRNQYQIIAASDAKHAPYLVNALISLKENYPIHPNVVIYDLGLSNYDIDEILKFDQVDIAHIPKFVEHYNKNWTWKLYALKNATKRFVLYMDMPNFVIRRSLDPLFEMISSNGSLMIGTGHTLGQIIPDEFWSEFCLDKNNLCNFPIFGAGLVGFDRDSRSWEIVEKSYELCLQGYNLGRSPTEASRKYWPLDLIRNCQYFRADQTILNISAHLVLRENIKVVSGIPIYGELGMVLDSSQYLWYSRRVYDSVVSHLLSNNGKHLDLINRFRWILNIRTRFALKKLYIAWKEICNKS